MMITMEAMVVMIGAGDDVDGGDGSDNWCW